MLLCVVACAANFAITLLTQSCEMANLKKAQYQVRCEPTPLVAISIITACCSQGVGKAAMGRRGYLMATWSIILQQLGACILYVQIIASVIDPSATFSATDNSVCMEMTQ